MNMIVENQQSLTVLVLRHLAEQQPLYLGLEQRILGLTAQHAAMLAREGDYAVANDVDKLQILLSDTTISSFIIYETSRITLDYLTHHLTRQGRALTIYFVPEA